MRGHFALRVGFGSVAGPVAGVAAYGDGVSDGDLVGADEDVLDEQTQYALPFGHGCGSSVATQPSEEVFEVVGEFEVDLPVGELGVKRVELVTQTGLASTQLWHAGPELVEGDQLFLEGVDQPGDRCGGLGQAVIDACALGGGGISCAVLLEPAVDLGADQGRIGEQAGDVVPDNGVEVVGAHRLVRADPAVLVAVVVRARAAVVVDLLVRGARRGAVVGVSAATAGAHPLQQRGIAAVARRVALVVGQPSLHLRPGVLGDQCWHGDLQPVLAGPVGHGVVPGLARPARRAVRFRPALCSVRIVLPKQARPA